MRFYSQYGTFGILAVSATVLFFLIMQINRLMRPNVPSPLKLSTYECGVEAVGTGWSQMNIRYYVFAFLFVIFDVEAIFLFPWTLILEHAEEFGVSQIYALITMFIFIGTLLEGLVYAYKKGVLVWE